MGYLIDGNNLIGFSREQNLKDPHARVRLIRELAAFCRQKRATVTVVFDGEPDPMLPSREVRMGDLHVLFAGSGRDADSLILDILFKTPDPASTIVVTTDKALSEWSRHARARTMRCRQFRQKLQRMQIDESTSEIGRLTEEEIADWMDYFSRRDPPSS
jgi:predicted RNA-binding protein with PIN domain